MTLADVQALGHGADADIRLLIVVLDVLDCFGDIAVAAAGFRLRQHCLLRCQLCLHPLHRLFQITVMEGLEQIVHRFQTQGGLNVGKAVVGGQDDDMRGFSCLAEPFQHFDAVHLGHFQVGDDEVRVAFFCLLQPLRAVGGFAHHHAVQRRPVHGQRDALADEFFVLHDEYFQHSSSSLRRRGSRARTLAPLPAGLLSRYRP